MTCGIYKLNFTGTTKVYIGQSVNIELRFKQHVQSIRSGRCSPKLLEAYIQYGEPTHFDIIIDCLASELDNLEDEAISIWNSVDSGFNTFYTSNEAPTNKEFGCGNYRYQKSQIIEVFNLLVDTDLTYNDISNITKVPVATVGTISTQLQHTWLSEEFPDRYDILTQKRGNRDSRHVVSDKLSAKARGIIYPNIMSPEGVVYTIDNAYKFAKERSLAPNHFQEVLNGHRKSHKGWKLV